MLRKDHLLAEIQKLAQVLARILGLKNEGKFEEADALSKEMLIKDFNLDWNELIIISTEEFEQILKVANYPSEKLDILGQLLFDSIYPFEEIPETDAILHKVLLVFHLLEEEHHIQSFENLHKRDMIDNFLNNRQYE